MGIETNNDNEVRSALSAAFEEHKEETAETVALDENSVDEVAKAVVESPAEGTSTVVAGEDAAIDVPTDIAPLPGGTTPLVADPAATQTVPPLDTTVVVSPTEPVKLDDPMAKAPGTWTPQAREKWNTVDPEVRAEVWKREKEASRAMTISANARKFTNEFEQATQPYLGFIAAENSTPLNAYQNMMQTAAALRVGTPEQKCLIVADVIKKFGVDLEALDSILAGQSPQFNPQVAMQQEIQKHLDPLRQQLKQYETRDQEQASRVDVEIESEINTFAADPKNEFYTDVMGLMGDLMELGAKRGIAMGLTEAYGRAILIHEPVRRTIEARNAAKSTAAANLRAQKAKGASLSITPSTEASFQVRSSGDSVRGAIEAAIATQRGR